jgi:hypothetical protein
MRTADGGCARRVARGDFASSITRADELRFT